MNSKYKILVTGAAGFLGVEHCKSILDANLSLIMIDTNKPKLNKEYKSLKNNYPYKSILKFSTDITSEKQVKNLYKFLSKKNIVFFWYNPLNKTYLTKAIKSYRKKYKKNIIYLIVIPSSSVPNLPFIKKIKILNNLSNDKSRNLALIKILN